MRLARLIFLLLVVCSVRATAIGNYWQQHVAYDIRVTLIDSIHTLDGTLSVVYKNNSPDTLREVYFHLYSNAFQPGSMMDERALDIHSNPIRDHIHKLPESEWGKYWINSATVNGATTGVSITGTIMRVGLSKALAPGDSVTIAFPWREQIPRQIRRSGWMSREGVQYSMSQWYPKVCEYDLEGWHHQEYIAREFYGVWGDFKVEITLPSRFIVGSTGQCLNPQEVGHGYQGIASGQKQGMVLPDLAAGTTTWKFHASTVHDFAWVADDDYIHEWTTWQDTITLHSFYKRRVAGWWTNSLEYTRHALATYSELFGRYPYRDFSTTMSGDGGMEYPQLIMITGYRPTPPSLAGVIAHEIAHQWFYGLLGSNETREAFMDEGFTTYATTLAMDRLWGDSQEWPGQEHSWLDWFVPQFSNKRDNYRGYQSIAHDQYEEPLSIPHDWFREDVTAGQVYGKTQAILSMLQYTLGNDVFASGMKQYFNDWHFKHPHLLDFQRVMERTANTDLDWFFDEWFKTTRTVDYEAISASSRFSWYHENDHSNVYKNTIKLRNNGLAVMPLDLLLHFEGGGTENATIPIAVNKDKPYIKKDSFDFNTIVLPEWDWTSKEYTASFDVRRGRLSWFEIDTSWRLQDLNWLNNYSDRFGMWNVPGEWALWKQLFVLPPIDKYYAVVRPILRWDSVSKINAGLGVKFGMNLGFTGDAKIIYKADPMHEGEDSARWFDHIDGRVQYSQPVDWLGRLTSFGFDASKLDGVANATVSITKVFRPTYYYLGGDHRATFYLQSEKLLNPSYPIYHTGWSSGSTDVAGMRYSLANEDRSSEFELLGEGSLWTSDNIFALFKAQYRTSFPTFWDWNAKLKITGGSATGATPYERRFQIARANNHEEQTSGFYRTLTDVSPSIDHHSSAFVEGGAGVRGFAAGESDSASYNGSQMLGANFDLSLPNVIDWIWSPLSTFSFGFFADAGWVGGSDAHLWQDIRLNLRTDAGLRVTTDLLSWLPHQLRGVATEYSSIPAIAFNFPLYENLPIDGKKPVAFRWALSIGSAF